MDDHAQSHEETHEEQQPSIKPNPEVNFFAATNFRNQNRKFGIKLDDRRRHMYVVGKTGMGKTTLLENMVLNDIYAGHGIGLVDPHGDFAEKILDYIPSNRINDVVYFNPADINFPIGFNILETIRPEQKHLVASGLMGVFKKIWPDVWSARMEYILNNTILALLDFPGTTLLGINRMLADEDYRKRVVNNSKDPVVKAFWQNEFANYTEKFRTEAVAPIQNKIGQFLSASVIRNIVAQVKSRINIREIMDERKIFIMNLSKGRIGEDNSRLLGGMLITKIQLAAMERVDIPEKTRNDFFLYVDEFQNFATESFANILSEARKYRLDLIMAHQYMEQLDETVMAAVIGNVGTMVTFRVGSTDAEILAKEFAPIFVEEDLVNLPKFQVYLKLMIDGVASRPFSATTLGPIAASTGSTDKVVKVSRERYALPREKIEEKIMRWSGLVTMSEEEAAAMDIDDEDTILQHPKEELKKKEVPPSALKPTPRPEQRPASQQSRPAPTPVQQNQSSPATPRAEHTPTHNTAQSPAPRPENAPPQRSSTPQPQQQPSAMRQLNPSFQQSGSPQGGNGSGEGKRKRKRKKKNRGGEGNFNPGHISSPSQSQAESVLLGDPNQKGMSLSEAFSDVRSAAPVQPQSIVPPGTTIQEKKMIVEERTISSQPVQPAPIAEMKAEEKKPEVSASSQPAVSEPKKEVPPTQAVVTPPTPPTPPVEAPQPPAPEAQVPKVENPAPQPQSSSAPTKPQPVKRIQETKMVHAAPSQPKTIPPGRVVKVEE